MSALCTMTHGLVSARTSTHSSSGRSTASGDEFSAKNFVGRFPMVPSLTGSLFSRDRGRPATPASIVPSSNGSIPSNSSIGSSPQAERHCSTCQCWRHTMSTQVSVEVTTSQPPSPFRAVFPGVMLYVPKEQTNHPDVPNEQTSRPEPPRPTSTSSVYTYYREAHSDFRSSTPDFRFPESNHR